MIQPAGSDTAPRRSRSGFIRMPSRRRMPRWLWRPRLRWRAPSRGF